MSPAEPDPHASDAAGPRTLFTEHEPAFRLLFSGYPHPMWVYDTETLAFIEVNDAAVEQYGYSRARFLAMRISDIRPPEDVPRLHEFLAEQPSLAHSRFARHRRSDGTAFSVQIASHPLTFAGRPARLVIITPAPAPAGEDHRTETSLHYQARVLEAVEQAVIATDAGGRIQYWNPGAVRLWQMPAEQALGRPVTEVLVPPEPQAQAITLFVHQLLGERWSAELLLRGPDGADLPVLVSANPFTGADGAVEGSIIVGQDITAQRRSRETLQFLAGINTTLAATLEESATLQALATLAVPFLGDWAAVDVWREGRLERAGAASTRPDGVAVLQAIEATRPADGWNDTSLLTRAIQQNRPLLLKEVTDDLLVERITDPAHLAALRQLEARSIMFVPLRVQGEPVGALTLVSSRPERRYTADDLALAEEVARRASLALTQAHLFSAEQRARYAAEQAADRISRLQRMTATLARALGEAEAARVIAEEGAAAFGAINSLLLLRADDGESLRVASALGYPEGIFRGLRIPLTMSLPDAEAVRAARPVFASSRRERMARYPDSIMLSEELPGETRVCIPLLLGETAIGSLGLTFADVRPFSAEEEGFLLVLGRQAAQALDRARLYDAEHAARERMAQLSEISAELAGSLNYEETLQRVAQLALPLTGDLCVIDLLEPGGGARRVAAECAHPADAPLARRLKAAHRPCLGERLPCCRVLATGETELITAFSEADIEAVTRNPEQRELIRALQLRSAICVPLQARGRLLGTMLVARMRTGRYTERDVPLVELVARRAAQAVDNALLYRRAQETARREQAHAAHLRMLAEASLEISAARTLEELARRVVEQARAITGARIGVAAVAETGDLRAATVACSLAERYAAWRGHDQLPEEGAVADAVRAGRPLRRSRAELSVPEQAGVYPPLSGWLSVPLVERGGKPLGIVYLSDPEEEDFTAEDEAILLQIGRIASVAMENLMLLRAAAAAEAAIQADALKTELLNTVSHELRTPLGAIKGFSSNLLHFGESIPPEEREDFLHEIDAAADRLTELVDNLLHVARLESGTLETRREQVALGDILVRAVEDARVRYPGREVVLRLPRQLPPVTADPRRLLQIAANLLDNAVKFSPAGGPIIVRAAAGPRHVRFTVADRGIGIPAAYRARIFDRFFRVPGPRAVEIGGTGLGLSITHHIVEQHGGRIRLYSREGTGTVMAVVLPHP